MSVRIAEAIAERIEQGELPVGAKLPTEMELAKQFGVSRPSIREALGALQFVGLIESVRGSGSRVIGGASRVGLFSETTDVISPVAILELFLARLHLEPQVMFMAACDPDFDRLGEAEDLIDGMTVLVEDSTMHAETDLRIHRALALVCKNSFAQKCMLELLDSMAGVSLRAIRSQAWGDPLLLRRWGGQHQDVARAIRAGNGGLALRASREHIRSSMGNAISVVRGMAGADIVELDRLLVAYKSRVGRVGVKRKDS